MSGEISPRAYQLKIADHLTANNGIVFLPTGSGKTFIAIIVLKRFSKDLQETVENGGKRAVFMCNTVELARQQAVEIRKNTNLKVGLYIGERGVDTWQRSKWNEEIKEHQVLVATAQVILDIVQQSLISIYNFNLVIIDECHHGTKNHPMHEFMSLYKSANKALGVPRIIGLTGVLLKGNKISNFLSELNNLEITYQGRIVTVSDTEELNNVMLYSTKPNESIVHYHESALDRIGEQIDAMIKEILQDIALWNMETAQSKREPNVLGFTREENKKKVTKNLLLDFMYQVTDFGLYCGYYAALGVLVELELKLRQADVMAIRQFFRIVKSSFEKVLHLIQISLNAYNASHNAESEDERTRQLILNFSTPKMRALLKTLESNFAGKRPEDICCLIFVERRYTAKAVLSVVRKYVKVQSTLRGIVQAQFMVGRTGNFASIDSILESRWNKKVIEKFRTGEYNVIVCSNVLEEGIDVKACNYVFVVDPLKTFNSYIQTKGRARSVESKYIVFTSKAQETLSKIQQYLKFHAQLKEYLSTRTVENEEFSNNEIEEEFKNIIPPFVIPSGACLLSSSAVSLLYRYCQTLPSDTFGSPSPYFIFKVNADIKQLIVRLPLQSTVKEDIVGDLMASIKLAKISASMKACRQLYENNELNDHLLPVSKTECLANVAADLFEHWEKYNDDVLRSPGKQLRRLYDRKCPEHLYDALPQVGKKSYSYKIIIKPLFSRNEYNEHILDLLSTNSNYGLLLGKPLPALAELLMFMTQGSLHVEIAAQPIEVTIATNAELEKLKRHHLVIFRNVLDCWKSFLVLDTRNKEHSYLLVPLIQSNNETKINWPLVDAFQKVAEQRCYSELERMKAVYKPEDWLGKVINKWYAGDKNARYIVTKIHEDKTPLSPFEEEKENRQFDNYVQFFETKYGQEIQRVVNQKQFLIEVKPFTERRNFLINSKGKKISVNKFTSKIILIPELCHNYKYPGDLWLQALFLPSILHRLHFLLHAENLRCWLHNFMTQDDGTSSRAGSSASTYKPQPLKIDASLSRANNNDENTEIDHEMLDSDFQTLSVKEMVKESKESASSTFTMWKDYIEPKDINRHYGDLYKIDIDYYEAFVSRRLEEMQNVNLTQEMDWDNCQLLMSNTQSKSIDGFGNSMALVDIPDGERSRIKILALDSSNCKEFSSVEQNELLAALTTAGTNDVFDMERFELLGDSFLKFSASLYLADRFPRLNEGFLSSIKSRLVSNRNLLYCILDSDIPKCISATMFRPNDEWLPPLTGLPENIFDFCTKSLIEEKPLKPSSLYGINLSDSDVFNGTCSEKEFVEFKKSSLPDPSEEMAFILDNDLICWTHKQVIADKVVADTLEALIGVCVKNYGIHRSFRILEHFKITKPHKSSGQLVTSILDLKLCSPLLRTGISARDVDAFLTNYIYLENNLGYKFRDRAFLLQALTHPSFPTNRLTGCYQELEFIGDAILDFLISCYIFEHHENMTPGQLTDLRSALVNNITLACICVRHRFHLYLLYENKNLSESINNFADFQALQNYEVTNEIRILMEENNPNEDDTGNPEKKFNISADVEVPKVLGDIVEALIAAVYLDSRDLNATWKVIYGLMKHDIHKFAHDLPMDPVRALYEHKFAKPSFSDPIIEDNAVMIECVFKCLDKYIKVCGMGSNSRQAKKAAAKHALKILSKQTE